LPGTPGRFYRHYRAVWWKCKGAFGRGCRDSRPTGPCEFSGGVTYGHSAAWPEPPNGLELRDTCTPWHCAGAARQGKCAAHRTPSRCPSGRCGAGEHPRRAAAKRPREVANPTRSLRETAGGSGNIRPILAHSGRRGTLRLPHASRVSRRPSTPWHRPPHRPGVLPGGQVCGLPALCRTPSRCPSGRHTWAGVLAPFQGCGELLGG